MSDLTSEELKWIKRVQRALDACPSDRIGFYTIGDAEVNVYDRERVPDDMEVGMRSDFCCLVDDQDARLAELRFPSNVHSTAG